VRTHAASGEGSTDGVLFLTLDYGYQQVQTTIVPVVVMLRIEDATNIDDPEKAKLSALFDKLGLPHVISETHFVISRGVPSVLMTVLMHCC
jgi:hypothetical protein